MGFEEQKLSDSCFEKYRILIHKVTGISIGKNREAMLLGRIRRRLEYLELSSYEEYLNYVKENLEEEEHLINVITTNETYFYRTPRIWDFFENKLLKSWNRGRRLNIWSAAASTGEEAHTLGILCQNYKAKNPAFQYRILATDIASDVVKKAAEGCYIGRSIERFKQAKPLLFQKYMSGDDRDGFKAISEIRSNLEFKTHNLFDRFQNDEKFDLILLRNVLIYFTKEDQEKVLANIHRNLSDDGYLIIGESESLTQLSSSFESIMPLIYKPKQCRGNEGAA